MISFLSKTWKRWSEEGIRLPYAFDGETGKPSETLLFLKAMTTITIGSTFALQFSLVTPTIVLTTTGVLLVAFIMYRLRKLDKFKLNLEEQSIELEGKDE